MAWQNSQETPFEERLLWVFVLRRTVFDYVLYLDNPKQAPRWKLAQQFLFEGLRLEDNGLTFEEICALFGWEPGYLQRLVKKMGRADIKKLESTRFRQLFDCDQDDVLDRAVRWPTSGCMVPVVPRPFYTKGLQAMLALRPTQGRVSCSSVFAPTEVRWVDGGVHGTGPSREALEARPS